jgi:hypothetical protein
LFLKIGTGDVSSGNIKSVDCAVEGVEYEAVCVADSFRDSSAPAQGLCSSVAASKSKSSKIYLFTG